MVGSFLRHDLAKVSAPCVLPLHSSTHLWGEKMALWLLMNPREAWKYAQSGVPGGHRGGTPLKVEMIYHRFIHKIV